MKTYRDCIPCFSRQANQAVRTAVEDPAVQERVLGEVLRAIHGIDMSQSPPAMGQRIHRIIRELTGNADPYRRIKQRFNQLALDLWPELKARIACSRNPMETAARLAIAGNVIDCGANGNLEEDNVRDAIGRSIVEPLNGSMTKFRAAISQAETILYLADNAGEIVFDRLLIEQMPLSKVTVAVRGAPVLNDATVDDAQKAGLTELVEVIDNGSDAPGTILEDCCKSFRERFSKADLVIAKGQGNYETLSEVEHNLFFLLKVKCSVIARDIKCEVGAMVLKEAERNATG